MLIIKMAAWWFLIFLLFVAFGEHEGAPAAAFVAEITRVSGWGQGVPGEYAYYWVRDGGTPARQGDQFAINYYSLDPFYEFYPAGAPPTGAYFTPFLAIDLLGGNRAATARKLGVSVNTLKAWTHR